MDTMTENTALISASKVNGTAVYNTAGESIGKIDDVMIDKTSGNVAYAIMSFGGFLGMGNNYYPIPWPVLKYDTGMSGYVVNLTKEQLEGAPNYASGDAPDWDDRDYDERVYRYYNTSPFWS
jgi:sporulation protein YlmC with PRC-barrel domain